MLSRSDLKGPPVRTISDFFLRKMVMENYEEFYRRCVHRVNTEAQCCAEPSHRGAQSAIHFRGRPVLQPKVIPKLHCRE